VGNNIVVVLLVLVKIYHIITLLDKTLCDKVCQWLATDMDFSGYSNFRHRSGDWNIVESGVNHLTSNGQMMVTFSNMCITVPIIVWETILL
jgi:hypothetical protein